MPDGNHPDDDYLRYVGIDGPDGHKHLWRVGDFERISAELGLNLTALEFCDELRIRRKIQQLDDRGVITRRFENLNSDYSNWQSSIGPSSLIVDLSNSFLSTKRNINQQLEISQLLRFWKKNS